MPERVVERVTVPHAVYQWKQHAEQRGLAHALQTHNREALEAAFARGLAVIGYERNAEGDGCFLLGPWNEGSGKGAP